MQRRPAPPRRRASCIRRARSRGSSRTAGRSSPTLRCSDEASRRSAVMTRVAVLSDVHGNAAALAAVRADIKKIKPDAVAVAGDLVLNGPEPAATIDAIRELEADGALVVQGNT